MTSWIMISAALLAALVTLNPRLLKTPAWRATVTPLASIIGSGFLIAGPILGDASGRFAALSMTALCLIAWLFGSAIRYNIRNAEPLIDPDGSPLWLERMDKASDLALAFAYFISVAYYLHLFAAFGLRTLHIQNDWMVRIATASIIGLLGLIGTLRGLRWLENIELPAVGVKLALISGLLAGLVWSVGSSIVDNSLSLPAVDHPRGMHELGILLGLVILVQGFETSRYLGHQYDRETRIHTMRMAQLISMAVYIPFIAMMTPYFVQHPITGKLTETAIIDILEPMGWAVAPIIIVTALASQLSAAIADMNGAGGLIRSATSNRIHVKWGYAATATVAILITFTANIFEIIVYASKAFVAYYLLQSLTAAILSVKHGHRDYGRTAAYTVGVIIAIFVLWLGIPAEG
ncbi:MAG: hypothetical protein R3E11_03850 [Sphingobium sp.]|nr:hypothetical protein [Sphingobium sp.]MCP5398628.1 hypothetical protein [Sphingomonas sp.]